MSNKAKAYGITAGQDTAIPSHRFIAAMDACPVSSQKWVISSGQARMKEGLRPSPSSLSCLLLKVGRIIAFSWASTDLFRLPWMAQVKLNGSQNKTKTQTRKRTGRVWRWEVSIGMDGRRKREGRAIRIHLKHA